MAYEYDGRFVLFRFFVSTLYVAVIFGYVVDKYIQLGNIFLIIILWSLFDQFVAWYICIL